MHKYNTGVTITGRIPNRKWRHNSVILPWLFYSKIPVNDVDQNVFWFKVKL